LTQAPQGPERKSDAPTIQQLRDIVTQAVVEAMVQQSDKDEKKIKDNLHLFGMLEDIGDGDSAKGIEAIRANHKWVGKLRKKGESVGTAIIVIVLGAICTGILSACWAGIKQLIGSQGG
jgi:hypothetical protein